MKACTTISPHSCASTSVSQALKATVVRRASFATQIAPAARQVRPTSGVLRKRPSPFSRTVQPFTTYQPRMKGLSPDSSDPKPPNTEDHDVSGKQEPADLSDAEYHEIADQYLNTLQLTLEEVADQDAQKGLEVEYSAGVMTITHPSKGTYVLNKQPPNKQIWLSSPVSGPKRFDWVLKPSGGMDSKQDTEGSSGDVGDDGHLGGGKWTYLRDGTTFTEILKDELDVVLSHEADGDVNVGREGPGASGVGGGTGAAGTPTSGSQAVEG